MTLYANAYKPNEKEVTIQIKNYLKLRRIFFFKHWGGPMGSKGIPDIIGVLPGGRGLFIEIKKPGGKLTPDQERFLENATEAGALSFVATDLKDLVERGI